MLKFSNKRKYSNQISFSPNSLYFAIGKGIQLVIYSCQSLKPIKIYTFIDFIEDIKWSNSSELILIGIYKRNRCEIRNISNDNFICSIDEGIQGMSNALFSPYSTHVLSFNQNVSKLTIRSLIDKSTLYIGLPKYAKKGLAFSSNGKGNFMALAERKDIKDIIGIYYIKKWICFRRFPTEAEDLQDIKWSYDNSSIIIIDTPAVCKLLIYNIFGDLINKIDIYQNKLGIKKFNISPNGHLYCLGLFDQTLRIYNNISYTCTAIFNHDKENFNDSKVNYYKEEIINQEGETKYIELKPPIDLTKENIYIKGSNIFNDKLPKIGVGKIAFSNDNNYIATKNDNMPNVLFIWDLNYMSLQTVLIHLNEICFFEWAKNKNILFISTNNNKLYYFTLDSCKILQLAKDFQNKSFILSNDGQKMMIKDNNYFITVNIEESNNTSNNINTGDINENEILDNQNNNFIGQNENKNEYQNDFDNEEHYEEMQENLGEQDLGEEQGEEEYYEEQYEEMQENLGEEGEEQGNYEGEGGEEQENYGGEEGYEGEEQNEMINEENNNNYINNYQYQGGYNERMEPNFQNNKFST